MKNVLCLTKYSQLGASSRVRILSNVESYLDAGFTFDVQPLLSDRYLHFLYSKRNLICYALYLLCLISRYLKLCFFLFTNRRYDLIYVEYEILPYLPWFMERPFYKLGFKSIVEYDDPIYLKYKSISCLKSKPNKIAFNIDLLIVSSVVMKEYFLSINPASNIQLLDTPIDQFDNSSFVKKNSIVGWIGTPSSQIYLENALKDILPVLHERNWRLEIIGSNDDFENSIPSKYRYLVNRIQWFPGVELNYLPKWSIGLLPLDESEWTYARDCYKAHMYMSYNIFSICTAIPATLDFVNKYKFGTVVTEDSEWSRCLAITINDLEINSISKPICDVSFYREKYVAKAIGLMRVLTE